MKNRHEGNVAIIEFLKGQMVVYTNNDMPYMLLCNETYKKSMNDIKQYKGLGGDKNVLDKVSILGENAVAEAMAIGCTKINGFYKNGSKNIIQDAFDIHYAMRFPVDTPRYQICETQYATVFDITNLKLYFRTNLNPKIREINFKDFEDNCSAKAKLLDIQTSSEGIVNKSFIDYSMQENSKCIYKFYEKESYKMSKDELEFLSFYPELFQCEK
jgi:penicillin V acylase-like amidase (Ntn superfamily)